MRDARSRHDILIDDVRRTVLTIQSEGGRILNGPTEVRGADWTAQAMDPQGTMFAVHSKKK